MVKVKINGKGEWEALPPNSEEGIYLDGYLKKKLDNVLKINKNNWDCVILIDGIEGSGKSTLAMTVGWYLSKGKLSINNISSGEDAAEKIENLTEGSVLILDEGELNFSSKDALNREQKRLTKIFQVARQMRLMIIVVCPLFFELSKYIAVSRSRFLINVKTNDKLARGFFNYYGAKTKRILYAKGKKNFNSYISPSPNFWGRFTNFTPPFYEEYIKLKKKSLIEALKPAGKRDIPEKLKAELRDNMIMACRRRIEDRKDEDYIDNTTLARVFGLTRERIGQIISKYTEKPPFS